MRSGLTLLLLVCAVLPAAAQPGATAQSCVDVKIGDAQYYNCLNRQLGESVPGRRFSTADAPTGVQAPAPSIGLFDRAATAEQLGTSFGHSTVPQRPAPSNAVSPLIPR